jgi:hypothetical protein
MVFPTTDFDVSSLVKSTEEASDTTELGRVFLFDSVSGNHVLLDGKFVEATDIEAVEQWTRLVITTEKGKYRVYDDDFGMELEQFKGRRDIPEAFVRAEIERQLEEQLLKHVLIEAVSDVTVEVTDGCYLITCTLTVTGYEDSLIVGEKSA